jgi:peptidoglycan/LPS O-acetylase OafA/YrhL
VAISILPVVLLIPAVATSDLEGRSTFLASRTMVWLGETTFAFYLVHNLVLRFGHRAFGLEPNAFHQLSGPQWGTLGGIAFLAGSFVVAVLLSWALYAWVERPAMNRWSRPAAARTARRENPAPSEPGELVSAGS